jgi:hypothetical protein
VGNNIPKTNELDEGVVDLEEHSNGMEGDLATSGKMIAFLTGTHRRSLFKSWR